MSKKPSLLSGLIKCRCPRCREGYLFSNPNPYNIATINEMPEQCPVCGLDLVQEAGFYWGAMYVSYGLTVALSFFNFLITYMIWGWLTGEFLIANTLILILLLPLVFRYSRVLYLYLLGKY